MSYKGFALCSELTLRSLTGLTLLFGQGGKLFRTMQLLCFMHQIEVVAGIADRRLPEPGHSLELCEPVRDVPLRWDCHCRFE